MTMEPIPLVDLKAAWADIADEVEPIVLDRLRSGDYLGADTIAAFEREFSEYVGGGVEAVACSSGTDAVELMVRCTTRVDECVVCEEETFVAQVAAVERAGRRPIIAAESSAGMPVIATWLYGSTRKADELRDFCAEHGSPLLEDASQAHGNKRAGTIGVAAAWSLYPSKNLGAAGQAGVVTFKDHVSAARARRMREHGYDKRHDTHFGRGWNMRMDALQADILRVKLRRLDGYVARRREIARFYIDRLKHQAVTLPVWEDDHAWHIFAVDIADSFNKHTHSEVVRLVNHCPNRRDTVLAKLRAQGIGAAVHYRRDAFGRETQWNRTTLSLPMHPFLTDAQVERVVQAVREAVGQ